MSPQKNKHKKPNMHWGNRRHGTNLKGVEDMRREEKWKKEYESVCDQLQLLVDPFDNMSLNEKKVHGLFMFYEMLKVTFSSFA